MSTILSKLNNAERQRKDSEIVDAPDSFANSFIESDIDTKHSKSLLAIAVLVAILLLAVVFYFWQGTAGQPIANWSASESAQASLKPASVSPTKQALVADDALLQQAFKLEGVLFVSDDPQLSKVQINGKLLKQGDRLQSNVRVETIGEDWVHLNVKGNRITLR